MKKYYIGISIGLVLLGAWYLYPTEYDKLMNDALEKRRQNPTMNIFDGVFEPTLPERSENDKTILGIDVNKNGIRDDVEIWINRNGRDYNIRMAMRQSARMEQERLRVCSQNLKDLAEVTITNWINTGQCLEVFSSFESVDFESQIHVLTYQNAERIKCLRFYEENVSTYGGGDSKEFYDECEFEIYNKNEVVERYRSKIKKINK